MVRWNLTRLWLELVVLYGTELSTNFIEEESVDLQCKCSAQR